MSGHQQILLRSLVEAGAARITSWDEPMQVKTVRPALPRSYERLCHETAEPCFLLPLRDAARALDAGLLQPRLERAIGVIYRPATSHRAKRQRCES